MFEFAISQSQQRRVSERFLLCVLASILFHFCSLLILIHFPELLAPGLSHWIKVHAPIAALLPPTPNPREEEKAWRMVAVLGNPSKMALPSEATLRKYLGNLDGKGSEKPAPTVRFRLSQEALDAISAEKTPPAAVQQMLGTQEPKAVPAPPAADSAGLGYISGASEPSSVIAPSEPTGPSKSALTVAPAPQGDKSPETASKKAGATAVDFNASMNAEPAKPSTVSKIPPPGPAQEMRTFSDQKAAITQEGSGLFDTKGFPLKEYADLIIERVKGNWYIPSTLQHARGRTTVIFYIDKDGRYSNVRIVGPSGSESFDITTLNAIINSNPFPPLPRGFPGDHIGAKFVFSYNESQ